VEAPAAERLVAEIASPRCFSLAGKTSLRELLVAFMHADVMVTNDSGPAHFASLTPIEVVTLFGPEHPAIFGSRNPRSHVVWTGLACSPCVSALNNRETACRENLCMQSIEVDTVGAIVSGLLSPRGGAGRDASGDRPLPVLRAAWQPRLARTADAPIDHS
jgi:ADP-heptose:LPS heptosyltransferase